VVDLKDVFSKLIALTAARTLLGREIREQLFDQVRSAGGQEQGLIIYQL
jgi:sterol 14-demethylase